MSSTCFTELRAAAGRRSWAVAALACAAVLLAGCTSQPVRQVETRFRNVKQSIQASFGVGNDGAPWLAAGLQQYDEGEYRTSASSLRTALAKGLVTSADQVKAHKYLAFIDCTSGHLRKCRNEFRAALQIDPDMKLLPAEAGHPIWGPIFRSEKARSMREAGSGW